MLSSSPRAGTELSLQGRGVLATSRLLQSPFFSQEGMCEGFFAVKTFFPAAKQTFHKVPRGLPSNNPRSVGRLSRKIDGNYFPENASRHAAIKRRWVWLARLGG